jgi:hypothetical protein
MIVRLVCDGIPPKPAAMAEVLAFDRGAAA